MTCRQRDIKYVLDSTRVGSVGRYINHSCNVRCPLLTHSPCIVLCQICHDHVNFQCKAAYT